MSHARTLFNIGNMVRLGRLAERLENGEVRLVARVSELPSQPGYWRPVSVDIDIINALIARYDKVRFFLTPKEETPSEDNEAVGFALYGELVAGEFMARLLGW